MSQTATYHTTVAWKGEHWGRITMGNGPEMDFSAPPDAQGHLGVLTPEDAFVAAANTCIMMMFLWAAERFKLNLLSYECRAEGTKRIELDRTETFTHLRFWPVIRIEQGADDAAVLEARTRRALQSAQKYSLVANSVKSEIIIEPEIIITPMSKPVSAAEEDMATIKVLGTGCHNCLELEKRLAQALETLGRTDVQVERIDDERTIRHYMPLDAIPGLLIDDKLVSQRTVPDMQTLLDWLKAIPVMEKP